MIMIKVFRNFVFFSYSIDLYDCAFSGLRETSGV